VGSLYRLRDASRTAGPTRSRSRSTPTPPWPSAYEAGAAGLPCAIFRGYIGVDLPKVNSRIKRVTCPFTGEELAAVPRTAPTSPSSMRYAPIAPATCCSKGIVGVQKEAVLASKRSIVTVEEVVEDFGPRNLNAVILAELDGRRHCGGSGRRLSVLCARLLCARQCVLHRLGTDRARARRVFSPG